MHQPEAASQMSLRLPDLLDAVIKISSDLDLSAVLRRIVETAVDLVDCRYGALGVVGEGYAQGSGLDSSKRNLAEFITTGMSDREVNAIGHLPRGAGLLGVLVKDPQVLRLNDLREHPGSAGLPPHHPPMITFLGVPVRVGDEVFGNLYLTEKRDGAFTQEDETIVLALASAAGVAIEKAKLYAHATSAESAQRAVAAINQRLLAGEESSEVLTAVAQAAQEISKADVCAIGFEDAEGNMVVEIVAGEFPVRPGAPMLHLDPCVQIPMKWRTQTAALCVANPASEARFDPAVIGQLQTFADQAVLALELADARRDVERVAVLSDRDRIARDLHDTVIQQLFAAGMRLEVLSERALPEFRSELRRVTDDLDATIREIRSTIYSLQSLDRGEPIGLRAQLAGLVSQFEELFGTAPSVTIDGPVDRYVSPGVAADVVAVVRELLSNVLRHAQATAVAVSVATIEGQLVVEVKDNGVGFDSGDENLHRSGLDNVGVRAIDFGGTSSISSRPGGFDGCDWTTVASWRIPVSAD